MSMIKKCLGSGSGISKLQPGKLRPEARHGVETEIGETQASHGVWTPPSTVGWWTPSTWASPRSPWSSFSSPWPPVCVGGSRWGGGGLLFSKKTKHSSIKVQTVFSEILFFFYREITLAHRSSVWSEGWSEYRVHKVWEKGPRPAELLLLQSGEKTPGG